MQCEQSNLTKQHQIKRGAVVSDSGNWLFSERHLSCISQKKFWAAQHSCLKSSFYCETYWMPL
jgi:hypothetical protein